LLEPLWHYYRGHIRIIGTREKAGYKSELWRPPSPVETRAPADWRAEIQAEIEEMVLREKELEDDDASLSRYLSVIVS